MKIKIVSQKDVLPWVRIAILIISLAGLCIISLTLTGSILPENPRDALIFQNALLLIVLSSSIIEYHFTKPADSFVNSLMGLITLIAVYKIAPRKIWWVIFLYCSIVFLLATICIIISTGIYISGRRRVIARITYQLSVFFGQAKLLYSILFLFGVFSFYNLQSMETLLLLLFWGFFIVIWPLEIPGIISRIRISKDIPNPIGHVVRTDWPNLIRVKIDPSAQWTISSPKIFKQIGGTKSLVVPLFTELQGDDMIGTGLCIKTIESETSLDEGFIYDVSSDIKITDADISEALGGGETSKLIGFIIEDSTIFEIKFETWDVNACKEGMLVWCQVGNNRVYYQIINGVTKEESFQKNRHGFQIGVAIQVGELDDKKGFIKYPWLPRMNTPVFAEAVDFGSNVKISHENDFLYGNLPNTQLSVSGPFVEFMEYHTAILGVTGSGKTELAFDMIKHAVKHGIKVVCIDLTAKYKHRLEDLSPTDLSLSSDLTLDLGNKLSDVETGTFGAPTEKKALNDLSKKLRDDIKISITKFVNSSDVNSRVGIISLEEISNTKATIYITEIYLSCLLHYARDHTNNCPRILVVVEEAHTVMPEPGTMGLGDYDSRGLVSKIAQIALQGRKYGVGLLVIAQRTATVSKSVLTQCNTIISFTCFDDTSLNFLSNVFGESYSSIIPNLSPLEAVIFGKGLRSERPLIVSIPYSIDKANK